MIVFVVAVQQVGDRQVLFIRDQIIHADTSVVIVVTVGFLVVRIICQTGVETAFSGQGDLVG